MAQGSSLLKVERGLLQCRFRVELAAKEVHRRRAATARCFFCTAAVLAHELLVGNVLALRVWNRQQHPHCGTNVLLCQRRKDLPRPVEEFVEPTAISRVPRSLQQGPSLFNLTIGISDHADSDAQRRTGQRCAALSRSIQRLKGARLSAGLGVIHVPSLQCIGLAFEYGHRGIHSLEAELLIERLPPWQGVQDDFLVTAR